MHQGQATKGRTPNPAAELEFQQDNTVKFGELGINSKDCRGGIHPAGCIEVGNIVPRHNCHQRTASGPFPVSTAVSSAGRIVDGLGTQAEPGDALTNREYRWIQGGRVVLLGLTVRRLDHPGSCSVGAHRVFGDLPELGLHLFGPVGGFIEDSGVGP